MNETHMQFFSLLATGTIKEKVLKVGRYKGRFDKDTLSGIELAIKWKNQRAAMLQVFSAIDHHQWAHVPRIAF